jgi:nucleotide-binding universal stress UspA family protein
MTNIIVGVDGSEHSARALSWAQRESDLRGGTLTAVLAWDLFNQLHPGGEKPFDPNYDDTKADAALLAAIESALGPDAAPTVERRAVCDLPARALLDASEGADLLVIGARGHGGFRGLLLGSVSQQCLHHAAVPVAVVRSTKAPTAEAEGPEPGTNGRVVVGVDGSPSSVAALRWALTEGTLRKATVEVVHAWEAPPAFDPIVGGFPYDVAEVQSTARQRIDELIDDAVAATGATDVSVERTVAAGGPAASVLDAAEGADLVVIGRRGVGGFARLLLGSVSENVARHAPCPVVVTPPEPED